MRNYRLVIAWPLVWPVLTLAPLAAGAQNAPSITSVMHKQYTVSRAPFKVIGKEAEATSPDWEKVQESAEKFAGLAAALSQNMPRRGSTESWRELVARHREDVRALQDAAVARDTSALRDAHRRIASSCKKCHDVHRSGRAE